MSDITNKQYTQLYRDLDQERRTAGAAQRDKFSCIWCGSEDGMQHIHRSTLVEMHMRDWPTGLYQLSTGYYLYYPCQECNCALYAVPPDYKLLESSEVFAWVHHIGLQNNRVFYERK